MQNLVSPHFTRLFLLLLSMASGGMLMAQCDPPALLPEGTCQEAPFVCLQDACYSTQPNPPDAPHNGWCGSNTAIHNPQYFLFQATSSSVTISISVTSCVGAGCGLQSAIVDACQWDNANVVSCNPGTPPGGTMVLQSANMQVDSFYWLVIDGCAGQICEYLINFVSGIYTPGIVDELVNAFTNEPVVCQGQDAWTATALNPIFDAAGYLWYGFPWGDGTHTTTYNDMSGPDDPLAIPDDAQLGTYEICVVAFSGCDTTDNPVCFDLEIIPVGDADAPPVTLCPEDFVGLQWHNLNITGPGTYMQTFNTPEGCPYDSIKEYMAYPEPVPGVINEVICGLSFLYENVEYSASGTYDLFYADASVNGCDSTAELNLDLIYLDAQWDFICEFSIFILTGELSFAVPNDPGGVLYEWFLDGGYYSQGQTIQTYEEGSFELFVSYEIDGVMCTYPANNNPVVIDLEELVPATPEFDEFSASTCALDLPQYSVFEEPDVIEWVWTAPGGVAIYGNGGHEVEVSWESSSGGELCVHAVNICGAGPDTCMYVSVIPSPVADFTLPTETCVDSTVRIDFTGSASSNAVYLWNFGSGAEIQLGGTGQGPHWLSWPSPGLRSVWLQIIEPNCDTVEVEYEIFVELLGQPVVNCSSTLNSITFTWSEVQGAGGFDVTVLQGPTGVLQDTSYEITGLAPGTVVEIEVNAIGVGACAQTSATLECIAQSCPPKDLAIMVPSDSICLGDVTAAIPLIGLVDGTMSIGTWSGPGVDSSGSFNPLDPAAGPGVHAIVFTYAEGTCNYSEQTLVYVFDSPTSDFSLTAAICQDGDASVIYTGSASLGADFIWDFGPGATVVSGTGAGPYTLHWDNPGMYSISLTVNENNCASQIFTQSVDVQPVLTLPLIQCIPTTSSVTLQWDPAPVGITYNVSQLYGAVGSVLGNQFMVNGLTPGDSIVIELTASAGGECPPVTVVASCVARNCPTPSFVITPVDDICLYGGTGMVDLEVTVTNGGGTGFWSGPGIIDAAAGIFNPVSSGAGSHTIMYNYTDEGCSFTEPVVIDVYDPPVADISNTSFVLTCENGNQLELDGSTSTAPGTISYLWSTSDGDILTSPDQPMITAGAPGTYDLLITDLDSGCEDVVSVTLTKDDGVPDADAGPDGALDCNISFVVLGGMSSQGPTIEYLWTSEDGKIISDHTAATITVTTGGTYELLVTDMSNGCTDNDEAVVSVDSLFPTAILDVADILDCNTESTTVSATIAPSGGSYAYLWETSTGQILSGAGTSAISAGRPGIYTLYVTSQTNGCRDTISVEVFADDDVITEVETQVDEPLCVGDLNGQIDVMAITGGTAPFAYSWSNQATGQTVTNLGPGTYSVTVSDANGCSFTKSFTLPAPVAINPDIGPNLRFNINEVVTISLSVTNPAAIAEVIWEGVAPACPGCFSNEFPASATGDVQVTVIDSNGCIAMTSLTLTVLRPRHIFIPSVFSPNGDNINDVFTIKGNTISLINALRIFDRWGGLVYEETNIPANTTQGWDGTHAGKQLNPGVYVYMAELLHDDGLEEVIKGDVTLVR